jgi:transposase
VFLQRLLPHLTRFRLLAHQRIKGVLHLDLFPRQRLTACPSCQQYSTAVHSSYRRTVANWPMAGTQIFLHLQLRRFFCRHEACLQRIFAEQFPTLVSAYGRHSMGVCTALRYVGITVGGRTSARLTRVLGVLGSIRMILRLVHLCVSSIVHPCPPLRPHG